MVVTVVGGVGWREGGWGWGAVEGVRGEGVREDGGVEGQS